MARPSAHTIVDQMLALMRLVNDLSPADPTFTGTPVSVDELARRLAIKPAEVRRDIGLLNVCSETLPGYFIDYDEQRDEVTPLRMDMAIDRTIGLTPREAMALLTALDAMGFERDDPLVEALAKALPPLTSERIHGVEMQTASSGLGDALGTLSQAIAGRRVVRLRYRGATDSASRTRDVEPQGLSYDLEEMAWYLSAWCRTARGWRTFRLDRMDGVELTDESFVSHLGGSGEDGDGEPPFVNDFLAHAHMATLAVHDPACMGDGAPEAWRGLKRAPEMANAQAGHTVPASNHADKEAPGDTDAQRETDGLASPEAIAQAQASLTPGERERGAFVATIPWVAEQPWLARMIAATFGGVEAIDPPELRAQVRDVACELLNALDTQEQE